MLIAVALVFLGFVGYFTYQWWSAKQVEGPFMALVQQGQDALASVQTFPSKGRTHLSPGQWYDYGTTFPTSGPHDPVWATPGFYENPPADTRIVHALEHGNVAIYIDDPGDEVVEMLKDWARLYRGQWDGVLVLRNPAIGREVILTAWTKRLDQATFDPAGAAAFIDAYRGRGPENRVR